jgi:hypothetical protein
MDIFAAALLAATGLFSIDVPEPSEDAMQAAFASHLADGVKTVLAYAERTGGADAVARIRTTRTDEYAVRTFRKIECRPGDGRPGRICHFMVEIDTIAGPMARLLAGRFVMGPNGLSYDPDA